MIQKSPFMISGQLAFVGGLSVLGMTHTVCLSHFTLFMRLLICHLTPASCRVLTTHLSGDFSHLKQSTLKVKCLPSGQQSLENWLNSERMRVAFTASGFSPFLSCDGIWGSELTSVPSVTVDFSSSSLDRFEGVDCLLGL